MAAVANERLSRDESNEQPGAILRAGQLTPLRHRVDERKLPAVKVGWYLQGWQRLSGREVYPEESRYL